MHINGSSRRERREGREVATESKGTEKMARTKASVLNARRAKELKRLRDDVCQLMFDEKENLSDNAYVKMGEVLKNSRNRERDDSPEEDDEIAPVWCRVVYLRGKVKRSDDGTTYVDQTVKHRNIRIPRIVMETVRMQIEKEYASCFHFMVSIFAEDMDDDDDDGHAGINEREEAFLEDLIEQLDDDDLRNKKIVRLTPIE